MQLPLLDPRSMYLVRHYFNQIKSQYLANLNPREIFSAIEQLIKLPLQDQVWCREVVERMNLHGIHHADEQKKIVDAIIILLTNQKNIAEVKVKHLPVNQNVSEHLTSGLKSLTLSTADEQLKEAANGFYHTSEERAQAIIQAVRNGADPNMRIKSQTYMDLPVLITFLQSKYYNLQYIEAIILANAELDYLNIKVSLMSIFHRRLYHSRDSIAENIKIFELLLSYGANPDETSNIDPAKDLNPSILLCFVNDLVKENSTDKLWLDTYLTLIELLLKYGADLTESLIYARQHNCKAAIEILEKYDNLRLSDQERQLKNNDNFINELQGFPVAAVTEGLTISQKPLPTKPRIVAGNKIETSANKLKIHGQILSEIISAQLSAYGITHNPLALSTHRVHMQAVSALLPGVNDVSGVVTAKYIPVYNDKSEANHVLAIHFVAGKNEPQCEFLTRYNPQTTEMKVTEVPGDNRYINGKQDFAASVIPSENTCYTLFIELESGVRNELSAQPAIEHMSLCLSDNPIKIYKITGMVINLSNTENSAEIMAQCSKRLSTLVQWVALQSSNQIKEQNLTESAVDYSFNGFIDKLKLALLPHGINVFRNNRSLDQGEISTFIEPLFLMMGINEAVSAGEIFRRDEYPDQLIISSCFINDKDVMEFLRRLNSKYGFGTAKLLPAFNPAASVNRLKTISLNLAVLIERILPDYHQFVVAEFNRNSVSKKYYQYITGVQNESALLPISAIKNKFSQVSESFGLTYAHNPHATFVEEIILRIFGIEDGIRNVNLTDGVGKFRNLACKLTLYCSAPRVKKLVDNINKLFPGSALIINSVMNTDSTIDQPFEISLDREVLSGPIFELYKSKLPELAENDPDFLVKLQIQCKTRQKSTPELVEQLNGVALQMQQVNPKLAGFIANFSTVLNSKRRATSELNDIDYNMRAELLRTEAGFYDAKNNDGVAEIKRVKKEIKTVEKEVGLRPGSKVS